MQYLSDDLKYTNGFVLLQKLHNECCGPSRLGAAAAVSLVSSVVNVLICRDSPVRNLSQRCGARRCLARRGWDSGLSHAMVSRLAQWYVRGGCGSDQAICLEKLLVVDVFGCKWELTMWGWSFLLFYFDSHR